MSKYEQSPRNESGQVKTFSWGDDTHKITIGQTYDRKDAHLNITLSRREAVSYGDPPEYASVDVPIMVLFRLLCRAVGESGCFLHPDMCHAFSVTTQAHDHLAAHTVQLVGEFDIVDKGIQFPDHDGCGVSGTIYEEAFEGIGESMRQAIRDAQEQAAQAGWTWTKHMDEHMIESADRSAPTVSEWISECNFPEECDPPNYVVYLRVKRAEV